jgi:hypothetical protein
MPVRPPVSPRRARLSPQQLLFRLGPYPRFYFPAFQSPVGSFDPPGIDLEQHFRGRVTELPRDPCRVRARHKTDGRKGVPRLFWSTVTQT